MSNSSVNGVTFLNDDQIVSPRSCADESFDSLILAFASMENRTGSSTPLMTKSNATVRNIQVPINTTSINHQLKRSNQPLGVSSFNNVKSLTPRDNGFHDPLII